MMNHYIKDVSSMLALIFAVRENVLRLIISTTQVT